MHDFFAISSHLLVTYCACSFLFSFLQIHPLAMCLRNNGRCLQGTVRDCQKGTSANRLALFERRCQQQQMLGKGRFGKRNHTVADLTPQKLSQHLPGGLLIFQPHCFRCCTCNFSGRVIIMQSYFLITT